MPKVDSGVRDAQIARERDGAAAAGRDPLDLRDRRLGDALEPVQHASSRSSYSMPSSRFAEVLELRDVGPGDERLAAGAAQDEHADAGVRVHAIARVDERLVHVPRHRVARLGAIEGELSAIGSDRVVRMHRCVGHHGSIRDVPISLTDLDELHDSDDSDPPLAGALQGIRVLDVTQFMAGPSAP